MPRLNPELLLQGRLREGQPSRVGDEYAYVSVTVPEEKTYEPKGWIGVDRNTTGHIAMVADPETGKVLKLGKSAKHIHDKYRNIRRSLQSHGKYRELPASLEVCSSPFYSLPSTIDDDFLSLS